MSVTLSELKRLLQRPSASDDEVQLFATQGELVVSENLSGLGYSTALTNQFELLLAAHFAVVSTEFGGLRNKKVGESEDQYKSVATDKVGFLSTRFGQQACAMDTSGTLTSMSSQWNNRAVIETIRTEDETY